MVNYKRGTSIKSKVAFLKVMIVSFFIFTTVTIISSIAIFKTIRIFVQGESVWTISQKSAYNYLSNYVTTRDPQYYDLFLKNIFIIETHAKGLKEILTHKRATEASIDYIEKGKNDRGDLKLALPMFAFFINRPIVQGMVKDWSGGNELIAEVLRIGEKVKSDYDHNIIYDQAKINEIIESIHLSNELLTKHEYSFSAPLIKFARQLENFLGVLNLSLFFFVTFFAINYYHSAQEIFKRSLNAIKASIQDAVSGNLNTVITIPAQEDIGDISTHLNLMYRSFNEQLRGRISAQESEARLTILADAMPQMVFIKNKNNQIEFMNKKAWNFFGKDSQTDQTIDLNDYCHPEDRELLKELNIATEIRLRNKQDLYDWFLVRFEPVFDQHGIISRWYGSYTDIKDQKLNSLELENAVKIRDQFLSIASHELKTPLTSLKLQFSMRQRLVDKGLINAIDLDYFKKVLSSDHKQINRIIRQVDDMLDISRIQHGKMTFEVQKFEINEFFDEIIQRFSPEFTERGCNLILHPSTALYCEWDKHRIEQVIINLLTNALKYGRNKDVEVFFEDKSSHVTFSVKDQGEGITQDDQDRIFELFERVGSDSGISGLGLGLFIVKQIVDSHEGKIHIKSEVDVGSVFSVSLPKIVTINK